MKGVAAVLAGAMAALLGLVLLVAVVVGGGEVASTTGGSCASSAPAVTVDLAGLPTSVAGFSGEQLAGAAKIMQAGKDAGLDARGQTIGVMTSIGESTLTAVDHGDLAGPDSLGWFQQRDPWGPREVRLDAYGSATMFFTGGQGGQEGLLDIGGWETMTPTAAAHAVQRNADPFYYTKFWSPAVSIVTALAGVPVESIGTGDGGAQVCTDQPPGSIVVNGPWGRPNAGPITSGFGMRWGAMHKGLDFGGPCKSPNYAASAGTVILVAKNNVSPATGYGTLIAIDHGGGVVTRYAHAANEDVLVTVGQHVEAGDQVSRAGTYGESTGCHLHMEVQVDGQFVDPEKFLTQHDVALAT